MKRSFVYGLVLLIEFFIFVIQSILTNYPLDGLKLASLLILSTVTILQRIDEQ